MAKQSKHAYPRKASVKGLVLPGPPELHEKGYLVAVDGHCLEPIRPGEVISFDEQHPPPKRIPVLRLSDVA
jgi:hypothetical protein